MTTGAESVELSVELADVAVGIEAWGWKPILNDLDKWDVAVPNDEWHRDLIKNNRLEEVALSVDGITLVTGFIDEIEWSETEIRLKGREGATYGLGGDLLTTTDAASAQSSNNQYRIQYDNVAADIVLSEILSGTGYSVGNCPSTQVSLRGDYRSRLEWVVAVAEALVYLDADGETQEADWSVDYDASEINVGQPLGSNKTNRELTVLEA